MRRKLIVLAAAVLTAALPAVTAGPAAQASAAAAAKHGHERLHAVTHSAGATWVRVSAYGVLKASGHYRPRALADGRIIERMVFKRGSFLVTMYVTHHSYSQHPLPPGCRFTEHLSGTYSIDRGRRGFAGAGGAGSFYSHINGRFAHHDGTCTGKLVRFRQAFTTKGTLYW